MNKCNPRPSRSSQNEMNGCVFRERERAKEVARIKTLWPPEGGRKRTKELSLLTLPFKTEREGKHTKSDSF